MILINYVTTQYSLKLQLFHYDCTVLLIHY